VQPVFRFAPSPNGFLHLGHAYSALFAYAAAEAHGGTFLLRIEDIDPDRSRPEFTEAIFEDLDWLGLWWPEPVMRQSERMAGYEAAAARLEAMHLLYPCFCARSQVWANAAGTDPDGAPIYAGTCRNLTPPEVAAHLAGGERPQMRLDHKRAAALTGMVPFTVAGPDPFDRPQLRYANLSRWGDVVIQRRDVPTSYHLSVVVDDAAQGVTHVTRGRDMEAATDIHAHLQMLLALPAPIYTFHRLVVDSAGRKLAKSKGSPSLRDFREAGWTPERVREELGFT
jgi:glutamyl-Q tRNA(Asp) synthetase